MSQATGILLPLLFACLFLLLLVVWFLWVFMVLEMGIAHMRQVLCPRATPLNALVDQVSTESFLSGL